MSDRPTYDQARRFLEVDGGWKRSRGQNPHQSYTKILPDGRQLYVVIPNGRGRFLNGGFFTNVLSQQLEVTAEQFWAAVNKGIPPQREERGLPPGPRLPYQLVRDLITKAKLSQEEVTHMTLEQARDALEDWQAERARR
jgi:hypothetical protein